MKRNSGSLKSVFSIALISVCFAVFSVNIKPQTPRRTATLNPTPTPTKEIPEIISRADEFPADSVQVIRPQQNSNNQNVENKIDDIGMRIKELGKRVNTLESTKDNEYDKTQKRLLLNLDILSRSEQRAESLRKQLFEMIEKESEIRLRLNTLEIEMRPEMIDRVISVGGSLRPEELRDLRRKSLDLERGNLQQLLNEISSNKANLQLNVEKADILVEKLRFKLEKDIDEAITGDDN